MTLRYAVIADIVGSRTLTNRAEAQRIFEAALERASEGLALLEVPYPTVGDEFQAVAYSLEDALLLTLRAQLLLPPQLQLRFGIGAGRIEEFSSGGSSSGPRPPARGRGRLSSRWIGVVGGARCDQPSARPPGLLQPLHPHLVRGSRLHRRLCVRDLPAAVNALLTPA